VKNKMLNLLLSPWAVLVGMITGIVIGINFKGLVPYLQPIGEIYLTILKMCVIPILAAAIITSIGKLFKSEESDRYLKKIITVFVLFLIGVSLVSIITAGISRPLVKVDMETQRAIGKLTLQSKQGSGGAAELGSIIKVIHSQHPPQQKGQEGAIVDFIINIIPENIFTALANGENLKVIFFFIVLGVMMKYISPTASENIIILFDGIFEAFQKVIKSTMYFLPFGLAALMATQISTIGFSALASLFKFILLLYLVGIVIFLISTFIIWYYGNSSYFKQFKALGETLLICVGTRNSFASVPSAIEGLSNRLDFNKEKVNLSIPLGVTLCRYGNVMVFAVGAIFAAQLYGHTLGIGKLAIIVITSVLAGMAASGAPGLVARTMISLVLTPIGIPSTAIIALLIAINPIIDSMTTVINVYPNLAAASIIANDNEKVTNEVVGLELQQE